MSDDISMSDPLDVPDWPWQWISGEVVVRREPPVFVELWYRSIEGICRYAEGGTPQREVSFVHSTFRTLVHDVRHAVVRINEPIDRAMRKVTEPYLGPLRAIRDGQYRQRREKTGDQNTFVGRAAPLSLSQLGFDGLPRRARRQGVEIVWRNVARRTTDQPPPALDPRGDWAVETYRRLDPTELLGVDRSALAGLPIHEAFTYQSSSMSEPYKSVIWKQGTNEVKVVTGTGVGSGPAGMIRGTQSVRTRTPEGFANLYASSPDLLARAAQDLEGAPVFYPHHISETQAPMDQDAPGREHRSASDRPRRDPA